jgi:hypothetical protein
MSMDWMLIQLPFPARQSSRRSAAGLFVAAFATPLPGCIPTITAVGALN